MYDDSTEELVIDCIECLDNIIIEHELDICDEEIDYIHLIVDDSSIDDEVLDNFVERLYELIEIDIQVHPSSDYDADVDYGEILPGIGIGDTIYLL